MFSRSSLFSGEYELREEEIGSGAIERLPSFEKPSTTTAGEVCFECVA